MQLASYGPTSSVHGVSSGSNGWCHSANQPILLEPTSIASHSSSGGGGGGGGGGDDGTQTGEVAMALRRWGEGLRLQCVPAILGRGWTLPSHYRSKLPQPVAFTAKEGGDLIPFSPAQSASSIHGSSRQPAYIYHTTLAAEVRRHTITLIV
jgi:hypothetical protein